jgi:hypothetical protein
VGVPAGEVGGGEDEAVEGEPLLVPFMQGGDIVRAETMEQMRDRADASLRSLPEHLRPPEPAGREYPVEVSARLRSVE